MNGCQSGFDANRSSGLAFSATVTRGLTLMRPLRAAPEGDRSGQPFRRGQRSSCPDVKSCPKMSLGGPALNAYLLNLTIGQHRPRLTYGTDPQGETGNARAIQRSVSVTSRIPRSSRNGRHQAPSRLVVRTASARATRSVSALLVLVGLLLGSSVTHRGLTVSAQSDRQVRRVVATPAWS